MSVNVKRALYGKMAGDSTLTNLLHSAAPGFSQSIYYQSAPDKAEFPYVIFQKQSGTPMWTFDKTNTLNDELWLVKGVDRNEDTADPVETIGERLKVLLDDGSISISGGTALYLRHESDVDYSEDIDSKRYIHSGSLFRVKYQA